MATIVVLLGLLLAQSSERREQMDWIAVSKDGKSFAHQQSGETFVPWGFNYDHDDRGRLIEEYWDSEWSTVESDFAEMKQLGANVVRIHLQIGRFLDDLETIDEQAIDRLSKLVELAERTGLYLDLTGLACYDKSLVPQGYDALTEPERWKVQARFWDAVAARCASSPAVFCYDLMNEPVSPAGTRAPGEWLGPPFEGKYYFVQFIALDQRDRPRPEIAKAWIETLTKAIRARDARHLITVGLVPWSLDRPGLTSGFVPAAIAPSLDFVAVHLYPESGKLDEAIETLRGFAVGKPVVVEEMFPLKCTSAELEQVIDRSRQIATGWIGFYWGKPPDDCRASGTLRDAIVLAWLELFEKLGKR